MKNKVTQVGNIQVGNVTFPIVEVEPCFKLLQYFKGEQITCQCSFCRERNETHEVIKARMDKIYKNQNV